MSQVAPIATKRLIAVWSDGTRHDVCVQIWPPVPEGLSFRCKIISKGLQPVYEPPPIGGADEMQTLALSLNFVRFLFEWHVEQGGCLFYAPPEDENPYLPYDLPVTSTS